MTHRRIYTSKSRNRVWDFLLKCLPRLRLNLSYPYQRHQHQQANRRNVHQSRHPNERRSVSQWAIALIARNVKWEYQDIIVISFDLKFWYSIFMIHSFMSWLRHRQSRFTFLLLWLYYTLDTSSFIIAAFRLCPRFISKIFNISYLTRFVRWFRIRILIRCGYPKSRPYPGSHPKSIFHTWVFKYSISHSLQRCMNKNW